MSWARPGVKCVCVDASWPSGSWYGPEALPVKGQQYTIRDLETYEGTNCCRLVEIVNPLMDYNQGMIEAAFALKRFRPLVTQQDDIALFAHHLDTEQVPA